MIKQVYLQEKDFPQCCTECEYYTVGRVCKLFKAPVWLKGDTLRDEACPLLSLEHKIALEKASALHEVKDYMTNSGRETFTKEELFTFINGSIDKFWQ